MPSGNHGAGDSDYRSPGGFGLGLGKADFGASSFGLGAEGGGAYGGGAYGGGMIDADLFSGGSADGDGDPPGPTPEPFGSKLPPQQAEGSSGVEARTEAPAAAAAAGASFEVAHIDALSAPAPHTAPTPAPAAAISAAISEDFMRSEIGEIAEIATPPATMPEPSTLEPALAPAHMSPMAPMAPLAPAPELSPKHTPSPSPPPPMQMQMQMPVPVPVPAPAPAPAPLAVPVPESEEGMGAFCAPGHDHGGERPRGREAMRADGLVVRLVLLSADAGDATVELLYSNEGEATISNLRSELAVPKFAAMDFGAPSGTELPSPPPPTSPPITQRLTITQQHSGQPRPLKAKLKVSYTLRTAAATAAASQMITLGPEFFTQGGGEP